MESVINHSAFPVYFAICMTLFFLDLFFIFSWLPGTFCNVEVMRNKELTWNSLSEYHLLILINVMKGIIEMIYTALWDLHDGISYQDTICYLYL